MSRFKFAACEWCFPYFGEIAVKMAAEAGFQGVQLADCGGSLNSHPLRSKRVQEHYLNAGAKYGIEFPQIHVYTLAHQGFFRSPLDSAEGRDCLESIKNTVIAASELGAGSVILDGMRLNDPAKWQHFLDVSKYAIAVGEEYGVKIGMETDMTMENHIRFLDALEGKMTLCFDLFNPLMYGTGYPPEMVLALGKERMDHFHYKDSSPDADGFFSKETPIVLMGTGVGMDFFLECAEAVKKSGFEGWIVSETMYTRKNILDETGDMITAAKRDVALLKEVYGTE